MLINTTTTITHTQKSSPPNCRLVDFVISADDRVNIKEIDKIHIYLDLARGHKKLRNMRVTVIPIVIGELGIVPKRLERGREQMQIVRKNRDHQDYS